MLSSNLLVTAMLTYDNLNFVPKSLLHSMGEFKKIWEEDYLIYDNVTLDYTVERL